MDKKYSNRIIGEGEEAPDNLLANPLNWRIHPKHQQKALEGVLSQVGWVQRVIVNQRTGNLVDGHLRVQLAMRHNAPSVPVLYVDLSEEEEALILVTLDPIAAMAATDRDKLREVLEVANSDDARVQALVAQIAEKEGVVSVDGVRDSSEVTLDKRYEVLVECNDELEQVKLLERLLGEGYKCRALLL